MQSSAAIAAEVRAAMAALGSRSSDLWSEMDTQSPWLKPCVCRYAVICRTAFCKVADVSGDAAPTVA
jgi:hypothetical protein